MGCELHKLHLGVLHLYDGTLIIESQHILFDYLVI